MVNDKIIKVCGMRDGDNIKQLETLPIDMIGFIFYNKSPRCMFEMPEYMPKRALRVGVFVNEEKDAIEMYADRFGLHYIQLHGDESPEYCRTLEAHGLKIIKAFSVNDVKDLKSVLLYEPYFKLFILDIKCNRYGGSGNHFDGNILN